MAMIDTYRINMVRKREELAKLSHDRSIESAKISPLKLKIINANKTISQTKSPSTIKSKLNEIVQAEKSLAEIDKKIAAKEREYINEEKRYRQEEEKIIKKREQDEKKRVQDNERQLKTISQSLQQQ
jgi:uncharacterized protein involved in exopolysaccharide biosynthesis